MVLGTEKITVKAAIKGIWICVIIIIWGGAAGWGLQSKHLHDF